MSAFKVNTIAALHTAITAVGVVTTAAAALTPYLHFLPGPVAIYIGLAVTAAGAIGSALSDKVLPAVQALPDAKAVVPQSEPPKAS